MPDDSRTVRVIIPGDVAVIAAVDNDVTRALAGCLVSRMTDCRNPKDDKYLELALAAAAERIVGSDQDLLVLHPWRGARILRPADYLKEAGGNAS